MDPVRTCVGCRARAPRSSLVRFVARDSELVVDEKAVLPGRGAWLHPTLDCFHTAIKRRAFGRALRVQGQLESTNAETKLNGRVSTMSDD
jgi:uncharacterized protein